MIIAMDTTEIKTPEFITVSRRHLMTMYIVTLGLYSVYWFYRHWSILKRTTMPKIWPIPRAIFQIFFAYEFFTIVEKQAEEAAVEKLYDPYKLAWLYVGFLIASNITDRFEEYIPDHIDVGILFLALVVPPILLWPVQRTINRVNENNGSEQNENRSHSMWESVAIVIGSIVLLLSIAGLLMGVTEPEPRLPQTEQQARPERPM